MWRPHTCTYKPYTADRVHTVGANTALVRGVNRQAGLILDKLLQYMQHFAQLTGSVKRQHAARCMQWQAVGKDMACQTALYGTRKTSTCLLAR